MKKLLFALVVLPFTAGLATAAPLRPLTDKQMDRVNAGFIAISLSDAEGGAGSVRNLVITTTATVAQVNPIAEATFGEFTTRLFKSLAGSSSSAVLVSVPILNIPGVTSPFAPAALQ
jgi:hypothetical protein